MQKRKLVRAGAATGGLVELLDQLELALADLPPRAPVCKALLELNRRLGTGANVNTLVRTRQARTGSARRAPRAAVESLSLFS
ncbi:hypothetical protein LMG28140_05469 [Paraburkholderia metrosideri]|jgi:hypothetical protein|uniref:Uncharacterized protein n=1 Tax=Paraburkholderia metrosideri TaxID=580937 RepID=A0ABN7I8G7_9BURK|nr:hypothetical protein LMG28140_05469 [Paraburkholderia metrosideri]